MPKLTIKQQKFIDYYIETGNATEAAKRAGYSQKTAYSTGQENLKKHVIKTAIEARLKELESERVASAQEVLEYLTAMMRGELTEEIVQLDMDGAYQRTQKAAFLKDRIKAAELLGKRHQLFTENIKMTAELVPQIVEDVPDE